MVGHPRGSVLASADKSNGKSGSRQTSRLFWELITPRILGEAAHDRHARTGVGFSGYPELIWIELSLLKGGEQEMSAANEPKSWLERHTPLLAIFGAIAAACITVLGSVVVT